MLILPLAYSPVCCETHTFSRMTLKWNARREVLRNLCRHRSNGLSNGAEFPARFFSVLALKVRMSSQQSPKP